MILNNKKYINWLFKIFISGVLVWYIFSKINIGEVFDIINNIKLFHFLIAFIFFFVSVIIFSKRWQILLNHLGFNEKLNKLIKLNFISLFYAAFLPGGQLTGEGVKIYRITRNSDRKGELALSVLMDRLLGMVAFVILGFLGILLSNTEILYKNNILIVFIIGFAVSIFILLLFNNKIASLFEGLTLKIFKHENKINLLIKKIIKLIFAYKGAYQVLFLSLIYSIVFQIFNTLIIYMLAISLGLNIAILDLLWIHSLVSLILIIPITIMGLGLREGGLIYLLSLVGIVSAEALSLSLLSFILILLGSLVGGVIEGYSFFCRVKNN
jgi:uncharacterized protein (TIRG00374 family)